MDEETVGGRADQLEVKPNVADWLGDRCRPIRAVAGLQLQPSRSQGGRQAVTDDHALVASW